MNDMLIELVIGRLGQPLQLTEGHENFFMHALDNPVVDTASKQEVFPEQKPISLYKELVELYTSPGDWIFHCPTGVGMKM